jgi:GrpB-like predicted nucleotidyltransferase (UPF0157 family)/predicted nucleotidyltransferase
MPATQEPSAERAGEVRRVMEQVREWARGRNDVRAVALVGSWVRGATRADSDVDLVVLTDHPEAFTNDDAWVSAFPGAALDKRGDWGAITERRVRLMSGLEVEFGIGRSSWAATNPVDPGTRRVVTDGMQILHDPEGLLEHLAKSVGSGREPTVEDEAANEPVRIDAYDPSWPAHFERERRALEKTLAHSITGGIHHVGSTSVPGLAAKPIIDILVGVAELESSRAFIKPLGELGYLYAPYRADEMLWFCKPDPAHRTHHLHLVPTGSPRFRAELAFRDYLCAHPDVAQDYATLKRSLATQLEHDREAYTEAKAAFIRDVLDRAAGDGAA